MANQPTFRELNEQLETILAQLQAEDLDVDEALKLHEQGKKVISELEKRLATAQLKITKLKSKQG